MRRVCLLALLPFVLALTPAQQKILTTNRYSDAYCEQLIAKQGPTVDLDFGVPEKVTTATGAISSIVGRRGLTTAFTQSTAGNRPYWTRGDERENRQTYSEGAFTNSTYWGVSYVTVAGSKADPFGGTGAATITTSGGAQRHFLYPTSSSRPTFLAGTNVRHSIFLKDGDTPTGLYAFFGVNDSGYKGIVANLATCRSVATANVSSPTVLAIGGGWCWLSFVYTYATTTALPPYIGHSDSVSVADGPRAYDGDGDVMYLFGSAASSASSCSSCYVAAATHPIFRGQGGRPGAFFDGTDDQLVSALTLDDAFNNNAKTLIVVINTPARSAERQYFGDADGLFGVAIDATNKFYAVNYDGSVDLATAAVAHDGKTRLLSVTHDGTTLTLRDNGQPVSAASGATSVMTGALNIARANPNLGDGTYARLILDDSVWPASTLREIERCIARKYEVDL